MNIIKTYSADGEIFRTFYYNSNTDITLTVSDTVCQYRDHKGMVVNNFTKGYFIIRGYMKNNNSKIMTFFVTYGKVDENLGMLVCQLYISDGKRYSSNLCYVDPDSATFSMISEKYREAHIYNKCRYTESVDYYDETEDTIYAVKNAYRNMKCPSDKNICNVRKLRIGNKDNNIKITYYECAECQRWFTTIADIKRVNNFCAENGFDEVEYRTDNDVIKEIQLNKRKKCNYVVANGKMQNIPKAFPFYQLNFYDLPESAALVVGNYNFCTLENHYSEDNKACVAVYLDNMRTNTKERCLFLNATFCSSCQKFFISSRDYAAIQSKGRLHVNVIDDNKQFDIRSGAEFVKEEQILRKYEDNLSDYIRKITPPIERYYRAFDETDKANHDADVRRYKHQFDELERVSSFADKPYRYRLVMKNLSSGNIEEYKIGMDDIEFDGRKKVYNVWGPIGKIYKNIRETKVSYQGDNYKILLRREVDIDHAKLYGFFDAYNWDDQLFQSGITDPFLISVLRKRQSQHQLTDILTTIQQKQNEIIEEPLNKNIVVQGCAGSGKTMVMLHRLSRLVADDPYFDVQTTKIITPNRRFDMHISNLAVDLRINGINRMTVEEYYAYLISLYDKSFSYKVPRNIRTDAGGDEQIVLSEKNVSAKFVDYIYSDEYTNYVKDYVRYGIADSYNSVSDRINYYLALFGMQGEFHTDGFMNLSDFLEYSKEIGEMLGKFIENEMNLLKSLENDRNLFLKQIENKERQGLFDSLLNKRQHKLDQITEEIKKNIVFQMNKDELSEITGLIKKLRNSSIYGIHKQFFREMTNSRNIKLSGNYRFFLYSLLLFAYNCLGRGLGTDSMLCFDEGQDISLNEYKLIFSVNEKETIFNIYGDINQLIKSDIRGLSSWEPIKSHLHSITYLLNENYRNTNQITGFCNCYFGQNNTCTGIDGDDVEYIKPVQLEKILGEMTIDEKRIAVIYACDNSSFRIDLDRLSPERRVLVTDMVEPGKICVSDVENIKGIECDVVFAVTENMNKNEEYIAFTRALSKLYVVG